MVISFSSLGKSIVSVVRFHRTPQHKQKSKNFFIRTLIPAAWHLGKFEGGIPY